MKGRQFMGYSPYEGVWPEGDLVHEIGCDDIVYIMCPDGTTYRVAQDSVRQFTGLLDSKGKKIYENDRILMDGCPAYVCWNERTCSFIAVDEQRPFLTFTLSIPVGMASTLLPREYPQEFKYL